MKKFSKAKVNYKKSERKVFSKNRRIENKDIHQEFWDNENEFDYEADQ